VRRTRILLAGVAVLALVLVLPATSGAGAGVRAQTGGGLTALEQQGRDIYLQSCAACHGPDPNGPS
jgi:mono/diheme cytochrome c family protein